MSAARLFDYGIYDLAAGRTSLRVSIVICLPTALPRYETLRDALEDRIGQELPELSMGMSADAEAAAAEGATLVRIGTALFGPRA